MAMLNAVLGLAQTFGQMGISNAIISRTDVTREQLSSLYWLNILSGCGLFLIVVGITPLTVMFYHEPRLASIMPWVR